MNLKDEYIKFFVSKGHTQIPSSPLVPENDPSVLFNTAGMQPLIPYLLGEPHPSGTRLVDYQKCIRTNDLDIVGDPTHHTFFEMLGNWSLGDYFKEESIKYSFEFLTRVLNIPTSKLAVTVFEGTKDIPRDEFSANIWKELGIKENRIAYLGVEDNFWIAGNTGPCGPDTEIFYFRSDEKAPDNFDPSDSNWVEIWNNVFMEFYKDEAGKITELSKKNVDTGMGVERTTSVLENKNDNYTTSIWINVIKEIEKISGLSYSDSRYTKPMRIIADHIRTAVFIIADEAGIKPSNTDQGYILRRLIRRAIRYAKSLNIMDTNWEEIVAKVIIEQYENYYSEIKKNKKLVLEVLKDEKLKFSRTLEKGLKEFEKLINSHINNKPFDTNHDLKEEVKQNLIGSIEFSEKYPANFKDLIKTIKIDAMNAFKLYDTYGFPIEFTVELANERGIEVDIEGFKQKFKEHQEKSRTGAEGKFKGGLAGNSEIETKYHTATHLLNAALKEVLGSHVHQKGSNITSERMRFDFSHDNKMTDEEIKKVEDLVNSYIKSNIDVTVESMSKEEALKTDAEAMFIDKYGDIVKVYSIGTISKEVCGGPHVSNTKELGNFKILKEEASSSGVRRIKAQIYLE